MLSNSLEGFMFSGSLLTSNDSPGKSTHQCEHILYGLFLTLFESGHFYYFMIPVLVLSENAAGLLIGCFSFVD